VVDDGAHGDGRLVAGVGQRAPVAAVRRGVEVDQDSGRGDLRAPLAYRPVRLDVALGQVLLDLEGHVGDALRPVLPIPGRRPFPRVHARTILTRLRKAGTF
jgi:hypothetical protein